MPFPTTTSTGIAINGLVDADNLDLELELTDVRVRLTLPS